MLRWKRRDFLKLSGAAALSLGFPPAMGKTGETSSAAQPTPPGYDPYLEINLDHLVWNYQQLRKRVHPRPVMAVIKANAYGHGLVEVAKTLEKEGARYVAVGKLTEAVTLRQAGFRGRILNFGPLSQETAGEVVRRDVSQSVFTDEVRYLDESARKAGRRAHVHIKVDTGLGRVGVPYYRALQFIETVARLSHIKIEGIFTTFTEDPDFDREQLKRFLEVCTRAQKRGISVGLRHAASSAGVLSFPESYLDMVRPGITLYGHYPSDEEFQKKRIPLRPVMSLKARVILTKTLRPGDAVSYHRSFVAREPTHVATLPVGYSDGYPYVAAGKAQVLVRGRRWPTIALVTANHTTIRVDAPDAVRIGDEAVFFGEQQGEALAAEELAAWAGTSVYKILIGMSAALPRIYRKT